MHRHLTMYVNRFTVHSRIQDSVVFRKLSWILCTLPGIQQGKQSARTIPAGANGAARDAPHHRIKFVSSCLWRACYLDTTASPLDRCCALRRNAG